MIFGLVMGLLFGIIVAIIMMCGGVENPVALVLAIVLVSVGGGAIEAVRTKISSESYCSEYESAKRTIESSMRCNDISGAERLALVHEAVEYNTELAKKQFQTKQWYNFMMTDAILELKPIQFEESKEE